MDANARIDPFVMKKRSPSADSYGRIFPYFWTLAEAEFSPRAIPERMCRWGINVFIIILSLAVAGRVLTAYVAESCGGDKPQPMMI